MHTPAQMNQKKVYFKEEILLYIFQPQNSIDEAIEVPIKRERNWHYSYFCTIDSG